MIKSLLSLLSLFFLVNVANAQDEDFQYGQFSWDELNMKSYKNDTSAHAVVLKEYGNAWISSNDEIRLQYEYHVKIKIFDNKGFNEGKIEIPIYKGDSDDRGETVTEISAKTTFVNDNGTIGAAELDKKGIFTVNENQYWKKVTFALPNLRNGCVIEYKYRLTSPYIQHFKSWEFQSDIPKMSSVYRVHLPGVYNYNVSIRGPLKLLEGPEYKPERESECFSIAGIKADCSKFIFAMKDIPPFIEEDYMTSRKNFVSAINFELQEYYNLNTGVKIQMTKEWKDVDKEMRISEYFGSQIKKKDFFKEKLIPVINGTNNELDKAKAVYNFIQKNYKWNGFKGIYSDGIRKAFEKHTGTVADINLSLVAALNSAGLNTEAVLLSTRSNGLLSKIYPVITEFDWVVAKVNIGDKAYYCDATDPLLPFGILPLHCLNDQGRAMSIDKPSYWVDFSPQEKTSTYLLDLVLQENGKLKGRIVNYSAGYDGYLKRKKIKGFNSVDEYIEDLDDKQPKLRILKSDIKNIDSLELPLVENYEVEMDVYDNLNAKKFTFNPFILSKISENPFKLAERSYPVDLGMPLTERVTLNIELPAGYTIETPPKDISFALPNNGGRFVTQFTGIGNKFSFSHLISHKKAIYASEEYPYLKEFYNQVILSEKSDLVFRKN
ncbi:DUF3857 domain-containing protein [Mucilaginibacter limnophilus]|uniref:DUF3857 domain-containing protein n=1 Tax=Mucilaginibacter limnophilus TaxID=1932778 RepID=A0A3S2V4C9_9SPHI|nr:DUF3857 domain-containing protein [Mucilaginibacter limnophilus]RVU03103.1 DUF3857 domain-containing protein [Mucilaginibacter limnophilus]